MFAVVKGELVSSGGSKLHGDGFDGVFDSRVSATRVKDLSFAGL